MIRALLTRLLSLAPVIIGLSILTFFSIRLVPGDVVDVLLDENYDPEVAQHLRIMFGLDRSIPEQFGVWFAGLLRGDLGTSLRTGRPVWQEITERFPATFELTMVSLVISILIAIPIGVLSGYQRNSSLDIGLRLTGLVGLSIPNFFLGVLLIMVFSVWLRVLPSGGYAPIEDGFWEHIKHLIMPAMTLGTSLAAVTMRMTRSSFLEVLRQDFVRTARAKGLFESQVIIRHALRNSLIPVVTVVGIQVGSLLGGSVVVEKIFSWPGMGSMIIGAILRRDYPLIQGSVLLLAVFFVLANFIVDVLYLFLNPRLRDV